MAVSFQLVIDCADPEPLARFWAAALGYELEPPPDGFASWDAYWRDLGVPEDELGAGADCIVDPGGAGAADLVPGGTGPPARRPPPATLGIPRQRGSHPDFQPGTGVHAGAIWARRTSQTVLFIPAPDGLAARGHRACLPVCLLGTRFSGS